MLFPQVDVTLIVLAHGIHAIFTEALIKTANHEYTLNYFKINVSGIISRHI